jgi:hypothetical protein
MKRGRQESTLAHTQARPESVNMHRHNELHSYLPYAPPRSNRDEVSNINVVMISTCTMYQSSRKKTWKRRRRWSLGRSN